MPISSLAILRHQGLGETAQANSYITQIFGKLSPTKSGYSRGNSSRTYSHFATQTKTFSAEYGKFSKLLSASILPVSIRLLFLALAQSMDSTNTNFRPINGLTLPSGGVARISGGTCVQVCEIMVKYNKRTYSKVI
jgi:hypothetical protein